MEANKKSWTKSPALISAIVALVVGLALTFADSTVNPRAAQDFLIMTLIVAAVVFVLVYSLTVRMMDRIKKAK